MKAVGFFTCLIGIFFMIMTMTEYRVWDIGVFLDIYTAIFFLIVLTGVLLSTGSFKVFITGINSVLSKKYQITDEQRNEAVDLFKLLSKTTVYATVLMVFTSLMIILLNLADPQYLGPKVAVAFISVIYGAFINMVLIHPAIHVLKLKREEEPARTARIKDKEAIDKLLQLCFEKGYTHDDIMNAEEINLRKFQ